MAAAIAESGSADCGATPGAPPHNATRRASTDFASSWVGRRATTSKALASALYLFFYYLGSSVIGSATGVMWGRDGWPGVVMVLGLALLLAMGVALRLRRLAPLGVAEK